MAMTITEALKLSKRLNEKLAGLRQKIQENAAHLESQSPIYGQTQKQVFQGWVQAHHDVVAKLEELSTAIQKTNFQTKVKITLGGKEVEKTIAQWIMRRQKLAAHEAACFAAMNDRGLRDTVQLASDQKTQVSNKVVRYYDAVERDRLLDVYKNEPSMIDAKLEVINATTQLVDEVKIEEDKI